MTTTLKRCLIIDDDESFRQLITRYINLILPEVIVEEYDPALSGPPPTDFDWTGCDLIILDYFLNTSLTGLDLLNEWKKQENFPPVIMMTAAGSEDVAVRAMKTGVQDYLRKQNLTREKLKQAIIDAVQSRNEERKRQTSNTQSSQSFNKSLFYKKLEQSSKGDGPGQVFILIELDDFAELGNKRGIILQDSLLRHIAKKAYNSFRTEAYQTSMTRMSDSTIGLLYTSQSNRSLKTELKELGEHLCEQPYENEDELIPFTVSIGAVPLSNAGNKANDIIRQARDLCQRISQAGGNDFAVCEPGKTKPQSQDRPQPAAKYSTAPATAKTKTDSPKVEDVAKAAATTAKPVAGKEAATPVSAAKGPNTNATESRPAGKPAKTADKKTSAESPDKDSKAVRQQPPSTQELLEMTLEMPAEKLHGEDNNTAATAGDFDIVQAFDDNRLLQYYQPIMPLSDAANKLDNDYYSIRIRMVDTDGSLIEANQIMADLRNSRNQKLLDRWMLRETIGRIVSFRNLKQQGPVFLIKLSEESFADASLFNWLQTKLMKSLGNLDPGKSLYIEVSAETYLARQRQVEALFKYLRQSYHYRFALSSFESIEQLDKCLEKDNFHMYKISQKLLSELQKKQSDPAAMPAQVSTIKQHGGLLVATFIESAAMLTEAINCGADFAMGYFIGEPIDNIGDVNQIESFEIT